MPFSKFLTLLCSLMILAASPYSLHAQTTQPATTQAKEKAKGIMMKAVGQDTGWSLVNEPIPKKFLDPQKRPLGVWTFLTDNGEEGYELLTLEEPKEDQSPPRPYVDSVLTIKQTKQGYELAKVDVFIVDIQSNNTPVRLKRSLVLPIWALTEKPVPNRPNESIFLTLPIPMKLRNQIKVTPGNQFRDDHEVLIFVEPVSKVKKKTYALSATNNMRARMMKDHIELTIQMANNTTKNLNQLVFAVDLKTNMGFFHSSYLAKSNLSVKAGHPITTTLLIPYPKDYQTMPMEERLSKMKFNVRAMGTE